MKIVLSTLMHGRHATVNEAMSRNEAAGFVYCSLVCTTPEDANYIYTRGWLRIKHDKCINSIPQKAQHSLFNTYDMNPDAVMLMGSDDYISQATYKKIESLLEDHDYIGFKNILFRDGDKFWLWPGYQNHRKGEPAGAGKVVRRDLLDALSWDLFGGATEGFTDKTSHERLMTKAKNPIFVGVEDGCFLVDIKDQDSVTPLKKFDYLKEWAGTIL